MKDTLLDLPLVPPGTPGAELPPMPSAPQYVASQQPVDPAATAASRYAQDPWLLAVVLSLLGFGVAFGIGGAGLTGFGIHSAVKSSAPRPPIETPIKIIDPAPGSIPAASFE